MKKRLFAAALIAGPLLWLFCGAVARDEMFVYRDAAHYYYPYYKFVAEQWAAGRVPLWNAQENLGQPLLADATAAVLYPGKLLFALPLGYDTNYKLYIVGHVLLAALSAFFAARGLRRSVYASTVCGLSYAFSGSVLYQYCNVVFLVGAAWLPLAMLAAERMLARRNWRWAIALAGALAMMVLGGDPQMAYHAGLLAILYAFILWRSRRHRPNAEPPTSDRGRIGLRAKLLSNRLALLAIAGGCAFVLAAVQILPSLEWTQQTTRAATDAPRNVYELASGAGDADLPLAARCAFLLGHTERGHHEDSYLFSVGPWHWAGFVWPNCYGNYFPQNTRWIGALPAEDQPWTPTLYMGLLPLILALSQLHFFRRPRFLKNGNDDAVTRRFGPSSTSLGRRTWLSWTVALALLASLGWYGLGWLASEIYHAIAGAEAAPLPVGWPCGGLYWLLQTMLPGYVLFRYPAKWLVVAAWGMAMLAAYGWDGLLRKADQRTTRFVRRALLIVLGLSMIAGVVAKILIFDYSTWEQMCRFVPADALFGPLDVQAAGWQVVGALAHTILLCTLLLWLIRRPRNDQSGAAPLSRWRVAMLMVLVAIDLGAAQRNLIPTVPKAWPNGPPIVAELRTGSPFGHRRRGALVLPPRVYRRIGVLDAEYAASDAAERQREGQRWDEETLRPKYHLLYGVDMAESSSALVSLNVRTVIGAARRIGPSEWDRIGVRLPHHAVLEMLSTDYVIVDDEFLYHNVAVLLPRPRSRAMYDVVRLPELESHTPSAVRQRTVEVLTALRLGTRDDVAVVETNRRLPVTDTAASPSAKNHPCAIVSYSPQCVRLRARLKQDGLVVLADAYEANWTCEVTDLESGETRTEPILRTDRVLRGVWLPAGDYEIVFRYRPSSFLWGALLSGLGWGALITLAAARLASGLRKVTP